MEFLPSSSKGAETIRFTFITFATVSQQKSSHAEKAHAKCIMSAGCSVAIKSCLFSSAKKAFEVFIKQQGSHYCTQQSLSKCSHIAACTCSLRTVRLIVSLLSHAVHSFQLVFPLVSSPQVAHMYYPIFRPSSMFVKGFKLLFGEGPLHNKFPILPPRT